MSYLKTIKRFTIAFVLFFAFVGCNQQPQNTDDSYLSSSLLEYINASYDASGARGFTQAGNFDVSFTPADLVSDKFKPLSDEDASCVLTFRSKSPFAIGFSNGQMWDGTLEYYPGLKTQDGWSLFTGGSTPVAFKSNVDDYYYLYLRGEGNTTVSYNNYLSGVTKTTSHIVFIPIDSSYPVGDIECYGTVESLLNWKTVKDEKHPVMGAGAFQMLFAYCENLKVAPRITSPVTSEACYAAMFAQTGIIEAPGLPGRNAATACYLSMFHNCKSLKSLPKLSATYLDNRCYENMFLDCPNIDIVLSDAQPDGYQKYNVGPNPSFAYNLSMFGTSSNKITPDSTKTCWTKNSIVEGSSNIERPLIVTSSETTTDISDEVGIEMVSFKDYNLPKKYVCRPGNGGKIEFNLDSTYSVWYLFSDSSYTTHTIPGVNELARSVTLIQPEDEPTIISYDNPETYYNLIPNNLDTKVLRNNYVERNNIKSIGDIDIDSLNKKHLFCDDVRGPSDEEFEKLFNGWRPNRDEFKPLSDAEANISIDNIPEYDTKDASDLVTPLGDKVGIKKKKFYDSKGYYYYADCRLVRKVKVSGGIDKYLAIYTASSTPDNLAISDSLLNSYADIFLKDGLDNDIYDKLTELFGTERGLVEASYVEANALRNNAYASSDFINTENTITIVFEPFDSSSSTIAYVTLSDYIKGALNDRCLVHINYNYGLKTEKLPITITHEFQHILYDNNFYTHEEYRNRYGIGSMENYRLATTEFFSILAETYLSSFLVFNFKTEDNPNAGRTLNAIDQAWRGSSFTSLYGNDNVNIFNLVHGTSEFSNLYAWFSYLSHYILANYGKKVIREYFSNGVEGFDGLVAAINEVYPYADMTKTKLIADWQTAIMLSPIDDSSITFPYSQRGGSAGDAVDLWNVSRGKVNFALFRDGMQLPTPLYYYPIYAIDSDVLLPYSLCATNAAASAFAKYDTADSVTTKSNVATRLVKDKVPAGWTFRAIAPDLPENVMLTVVAVPLTQVSL